MKRKVGKLLTVIFLLLFLTIIGFLALGFYYLKGFGVNTWINGVYCTGKTVQEVNEELLADLELPVVTIWDASGAEYQIALADMNYQADYWEKIQEIYSIPNSFFWLENLSVMKEYEISPNLSFDKELLRETLEGLAPVREAVQRKEEYYLEYGEEYGYRLYNGLAGRMDVEKVFCSLINAIETGENSLSLQNPDFYYDVPLTLQQKETELLWNKLEDYFRCDIVYHMGTEQLTFSTKQLSDFLKSEDGIPVLEEDGNLVLDEAAVEQYVRTLAEAYDTYGREREFQSTRGDVVKVKGGTYGTQLNQKKETAFLMENLLAPQWHTGKEQNHVPSYKREGFVRGKDDIGDTYIEIDMTQQKLYYYRNGELQLETDVVTGNMRRNMGTPSGVNYVYNKQRDRVLRGKGYASPVDYWMPVNGGIGIHDADWRKEFGGEIYLKNGSHGCINVPPEKMPDLYEAVEIGTPVVMFY